MDADPKVAESQGTYSVKYLLKKWGCLEASDWDWEHKGQWGVSDTDGVKWYPQDKKSFLEHPYAYIAVLEHFGLLEFWDEYNVDEVMFMSPRRLAAERRRHELENLNLTVKPREEMMTHNAPHKLFAEDYIERGVKTNVG